MSQARMQLYESADRPGNSWAHAALMHAHNSEGSYTSQAGGTPVVQLLYNTVLHIQALIGGYTRGKWLSTSCCW